MITPSHSPQFHNHHRSESNFMSIPYCLHKLINLFTWPLVLLQPISSFTDAVQYSPPSRCPLVIITFYLSTACCNLFTFTQTSLGIKHQTKISTMNIFRILRRSSFHFPPCFPPSWPHLGGWIWMRILCIHAHEPILRTHASFVRILERLDLMHLATSCNAVSIR